MAVQAKNSSFSLEKDKVLVNLQTRTGFNTKTFYFECVDADVSLLFVINVSFRNELAQRRKVWLAIKRALEH